MADRAGATVSFINCFEVPPAEEESFLQLWREVNGYAQAKPGYLGHTLHRALGPGGRYRYVNVARWSSQEHFAAATDAHFHSLISQPGWAPITSTAALYEVVDRVDAFGPGDPLTRDSGGVEELLTSSRPAAPGTRPEPPTRPR